MIAEVVDGGFRFGILISALLFGLRHGIDWDHLAAITDITGSTEDRRRAFLFGTLYALGHALVVFVLGVVAIVLGDRLPDTVDSALGRVVGVTLLILGLYVFISLIRHGRDFRMRSRWMLLFRGVRNGARWVRQRVGAAVGNGGSPVSVATSEAAGAQPSLIHHGHHGRPGHHHHARPEPEDDGFASYGSGTTFAVGMIHGVGAETPTQVLIFLAAAGAGGVLTGILALLAFVVGLVATNSLITVSSALGFVSAQRNFALYASIAVVTGVFSLVIGAVFVLGADHVLPGFFAG